MTIDDVMRLAREASHKRATEANWHGLRAAILALLDTEAEACAGVCDMNANVALDERTRLDPNVDRRVIYAAMAVSASNCCSDIRARIASRKAASAGEG